MDLKLAKEPRMEQYARLRPLIDVASTDIGATLRALVGRVERHDLVGTVRFSLLTDTGPQRWDVELATKKFGPAVQSATKTSKPQLDLEVIMTAATWAEITAGRIAPLTAFAAGKLRLRGDAKLANILYENLKSDAGGVTSVCK
jgi:hypothetical protein